MPAQGNTDKKINKSARKRVKTDAKKKVRNHAFKSTMRTAVKKFFKAKNKEEAKDLYTIAQSLLDKSAQRNLIHRNCAARKKSRLIKFINKMS